MRKIILVFALCICGMASAQAQTSGTNPPPPPVCSASNAGSLYTQTSTSPNTVWTCSYYNLQYQWVVNPTYGGLVYYPTVPATCSGALPLFLAGYPNTSLYICIQGKPSAVPPSTLISGQSPGVIPLATATNAIGAQSHLSDDGAKITSTEPFNGTSGVFSGTVNAAGGFVGNLTGLASQNLPSAGGTLTGTLNGTSADFSGAVGATGGFTGNLTGLASQNLPIAGGTLTGALNSPETNKVYNAASCGFASSPSWCSGSDIGAWVNAAFAAGAKSVMIPAGTYNFSTPISINFSGADRRKLACEGQGTELNYTGSGNAITIDGGSTADPNMSMTISECYFEGGSAASNTNGIYLHDSQNVYLNHVRVRDFTGNNLFTLGSLGLHSVDSSFEAAGAWNVVLSPDTTNSIASNNNSFSGGQMVYGTSGNFWDSATGDENNIVDGVAFEESLGVPQILLEGTYSDAVRNSYIEYNIAPVAQMVCGIALGNYAGTGWGSNASETSRGTVLDNLYMSTVASSGSNVTAHICMLQTEFAHVGNAYGYGSPEYGVYFSTAGTGNTNDYVGPNKLDYAVSEYNSVPTGSLAWVPWNQTPSVGEFTYSQSDGTVYYGDLSAGYINVVSPITSGYAYSSGYFAPSMSAGGNVCKQIGVNTSTYNVAQECLSYTGSGSTSNLYLFGMRGFPDASVNYQGTMNAPGGYQVNGTPLASTNLSDSGAILKSCGTATFTSSTSSAALACSWVTTSSHCQATWVGTVPTPTHTELGYTVSTGSVTLNTGSSVTASASVACSAN